MVDTKQILMMRIPFLFIVALLAVPLVLTENAFAREDSPQVTTISAETESESEEAMARARIAIDEKIYHTYATIGQSEVPTSDLSASRCGVTRSNEIVCRVTPYDGSDRAAIDDDNTLYCWGNNELRRCPDAEMVAETGRGRGGGAGKVSVSDIRIRKSSDAGDDGHEEDIEVYSWAWGAALSESDSTDADEDNLELIYAWQLNREQTRHDDDDKPAETLSLSFGKVEMAFEGGGGSGGRIVIDIPEVRASADSLLFTSVMLDATAYTEDSEVCGSTAHLLSEGRCDDETVDTTRGPPDTIGYQGRIIQGNETRSAVTEDDLSDALNRFTRVIENIESALERCRDDVCRRVSDNADVRKRLVERAKTDILNSPPVVSEIRGIVKEDIAALERCRTDVCREVLRLEGELLQLTDDYIASMNLSRDTIWEEESPRNRTVEDYRGDDDSDQDEPTPRDDRREDDRTEDRASSQLAERMTRGLSPGELSEDEKREARERLSEAQELRGADFGLSVALSASENERVRSIRYDEERNVVEIDHDDEVRLFGIFRMNARSRTTVHEDGTEETRRPWWSFLAAKDDGPRFKAGSELSKSVD